MEIAVLQIPNIPEMREESMQESFSNYTLCLAAAFHGSAKISSMRKEISFESNAELAEPARKMIGA
ncbi:MAG TPA: hypothetical protein VLA68_01235 [Nitrososphaera sp.]|nr:hypothetical protein [Nitrososphaera sp.]